MCFLALVASGATLEVGGTALGLGLNAWAIRLAWSHLTIILYLMITHAIPSCLSFEMAMYNVQKLFNPSQQCALS